MKNGNKSKAIMYIIMSAFFFAAMNTFVRLSGDIPSMQKSVFRNAVAIFFALGVIVKSKIPLHIKKEDVKYHAARAIFGTTGILCSFYAVDHMMIADASILSKLAPFFAIIFSYFLLKEKIKAPQIGFILIAFVGMILIVRPGFTDVSIVPALVGVFGGIVVGAAYTYVRVLSSRGVPGPIIVFVFSTCSCLMILPFVIFSYTPMTFEQFGYLMLAGLAASGGQFTVTAAYANAPAVEISVYDYTQMIFATFFSFLLFGEVPDSISFIGYAIICSAGYLMYRYNKNESKKELAKR